MKASYEHEGRFIAEGPPGLLVSTLPAFWFLPGILSLYPEAKNRRFLLADHPQPGDIRTLREFGVVWRYVDGEVRPDPALYARLVLRRTPTK
jgi:hypothetical protein